MLSLHKSDSNQPAKTRGAIFGYNRGGKEEEEEEVGNRRYCGMYRDGGLLPHSLSNPKNGHVVVASSSGGNWLKQSGRGGLCSVPGAGVWCEEGMGCVCSGYGECFMRSLFAKRCCDLRGTADQITELMQNTLLKDTQRLKITLDPVFAVAFLDERQSALHIVHSSTHFGFGYRTETTSQVEIAEKTNTEQFHIHTIHIFRLC